jgi:hypothetical protein
MAFQSLESERSLLRELGALSDKIRALRTHNAGEHGDQIKALEAEQRSKWDALRALRAGPVAAQPEPSRRSLYS